MQAQIDRIEVVESDKTVRAVLVKDAEKTTEDRNKVFQRLSDWWLNYKIVLLYVFKNDPQQLEAFGIKGYSQGYKPKRKEKPPEGEEPNPDQPGSSQDAQEAQDTENPTDTVATDI